MAVCCLGDTWGILVYSSLVPWWHSYPSFRPRPEHPLYLVTSVGNQQWCLWATNFPRASLCCQQRKLCHALYQRSPCSYFWTLKPYPPDLHPPISEQAHSLLTPLKMLQIVHCIWSLCTKPPRAAQASDLPLPIPLQWSEAQDSHF